VHRRRVVGLHRLLPRAESRERGRRCFKHSVSSVAGGTNVVRNEIKQNMRFIVYTGTLTGKNLSHFFGLEQWSESVLGAAAHVQCSADTQGTIKFVPCVADTA
jgi:hypothetical protein